MSRFIPLDLVGDMSTRMGVFSRSNKRPHRLGRLPSPVSLMAPKEDNDSF